ncbi:MBL fold metallo-hydrolase [Actinokineospora bangkokensis]|uniref:MBL fold metallo-hydrolase n=1 Tax=Actinokineospora bangkokensis TaxID=1193682 RepID=A0A1Q9LLM5_9PSEU|nr:MBL fold metallo-hydrolase [Actinokineospora bangkokensis]OLR92930.1 MBL fold metallo-hydrolase [Actinokineospora bangkokensis]
MDDPAGTLTFIGNATVLLRLGPFTVLTDPNFLRRGQWSYFGQGLVSRRRHDPALRVDELPELDAVVLSHLHGDHFDRVAARGLDKDVPLLTTPHAARRLGRRGFRATEGMATWASTTLTRGPARLSVTSLPGRHALGAVARLLPPVMGSMVEFWPGGTAEPVRVYLSGDTLVHRDLDEIRERYDRVDLGVVHLGGTKVLGVLLTMDGEQGVDLLEVVRPRLTVPVHFDDYGLMKSPLSDFTGAARRRRPPSEITCVGRGQTIPIPAPGH